MYILKPRKRYNKEMKTRGVGHQLINEAGNSFSIAFNMAKIKYTEYDSSIENAGFLKPTDKVNVFINLETVMSYLSRVRDLDKKMILERSFPKIMIAEAINLCAHYKRFFRQNGLETRVFLYYTDLSKDLFPQSMINDEYRSYYINKYLYNPKFSSMGEKLISTITPEISTICEFIQGVYMIKATGIEGSLVPMIISEMDKSYKNFIVTGDIYDTIYMRKDNFCVHYMKKSSTKGSLISHKPSQSLRVFLNEDIEDDVLDIFNNQQFYTLLLSALGDDCRSIDGPKGLGTKNIIKYLMSNINDGNLKHDTKNVEMLISEFPDKLKMQLHDNYNCLDIDYQYSLLSTSDLFSIEKQIVDRFDNNSLMQLNASKFYEHRLMLQELTM